MAGVRGYFYQKIFDKYIKLRVNGWAENINMPAAPIRRAAANSTVNAKF